MVRRCGLRDDQWQRIEYLLPDQENTVGVTAKDNRLFLEAVIYRYWSGIPWRDLPERFGDWNNIARRHKCWSDNGVWQRVFEHLATDADNEYTMIDSTIVRAHQHASRAKGGQGADALLPDILCKVKAFLADKAYDACARSS